MSLEDDLAVLTSAAQDFNTKATEVVGDLSSIDICPSGAQVVQSASDDLRCIKQDTTYEIPVHYADLQSCLSMLETKYWPPQVTITISLPLGRQNMTSPINLQHHGRLKIRGVSATKMTVYESSEISTATGYKLTEHYADDYGLTNHDGNYFILIDTNDVNLEGSGEPEPSDLHCRIHEGALKGSFIVPAGTPAGESEARLNHTVDPRISRPIDGIATEGTLIVLDTTIYFDNEKNGIFISENSCLVLDDVVIRSSMHLTDDTNPNQLPGNERPLIIGIENYGRLQIENHVAIGGFTVGLWNKQFSSIKGNLLGVGSCMEYGIILEDNSIASLKKLLSCGNRKCGVMVNSNSALQISNLVLGFNEEEIGVVENWGGVIAGNECGLVIDGNSTVKMEYMYNFTIITNHIIDILVTNGGALAYDEEGADFSFSLVTTETGGAINDTIFYSCPGL